MRVILSAVFSILIGSLFAQTITSAQDGDWNSTSTWIGGVIPTSTNSTLVTIANGHTVTIPVSYSATAISITISNFSNTFLIIDDNGSLSFTGTLTTGGPLGGNGRLTVNGTLIVEQGALMLNTSTTKFRVGATGIYRHNYTSSAGVIYPAQWSDGGTMEITGYTTNIATPSGLDQTFENFTWRCANQANNIYLAGSILGDVDGNFRVENTGTNILGLTPTIDQTLDFDGDLFLATDVFFDLNNSATNTTVNLKGNLFIGSDDALAHTGAGVATVNFNGADPQTIVCTSSLVTAIDFIVEISSIVILPDENFISGTNVSLTVDGTLIVGSSNANGAIQSGTSNGNIRIPVANRTFSDGSTVIYSATIAQFIGNGHPSSSGVNTIIDNQSSSGVALATNTTIGGNLTLADGDLSIGIRTLTLLGTLTPNSNSLVTTSSSNITILGAGPFGTLPLSGSTTIHNFSINRTPGGNVTLGSNMTIDGDFTQTDGTLILNGNDLTISGNYTGNGDISSSATSSLIIEDNGTLPAQINITGGSMETLTLNRPSVTVAIPSTVTVTNLNLLQGVYNNTGGNTNMADGGTITRSVGSMTQAPGALGTYNIVYNGTVPMATGPELPTVTTRLNNLTNQNSGTVTLSANVTINGNLTLSSGSLDATSRTIMLRGNLISNASGIFTSSTLVLAGTTTIGGSNIPDFANITLNSGATLTSTQDILTLNGNLILNPGGTFNHNNGTIEFTGGADQSLGGGGKNLNNITINKTAGAVNMTSAANLLGLLSVQSATVVNTANGLTLISTSDGTSGNASVGPLASGASITGNVTVQRFMSEEGRIYRYISSPVANPPVTQLQDDFPITGTFSGASTCTGCLTNPSMYYWDETTTGDLTEGYFPFPVSANTEILTTGLGYAAFIRDNIIPGPVTIDLTGILNQGSIPLPVTYTSTGNTADGYNLVGNPYPSTIDWNLVTNRSNIANTIAVRDNGGGGAGVLLYWDGSGETSWPDGYIATAQGFWVRADGSNPSLILDESVKTNDTGGFYRENQKEEVNMFKIFLAKGGVVDRAYLRVRSDSQVELDKNDAPKLDNELFDISTLTPGGISMAINATNEMICDAINIKIKDMTAGSYTLSVESVGLFTNFSATVVDNFTNTMHNFGETPEYQFMVTTDPASFAENRFSMLLDQPAINPDAISSSLEELDCNEDYKITLDNTQAGVFYFADLNGVVLSDSILSNGTDPIVITIDSAKLGMGANAVVIKGYNYCETIPMTNSVAVNHDILYNATASNETQCLEGAVDLEAQGAPVNGSYNWYEEETSSEPIQGQHGNIYTTPVLFKTSTYYVAAVNSNGCEGARIPVIAEVIQYVPVTISETTPGELTSSYSEGNQWYLDGVIIDGATDQTIVSEESGLYKVEVSLEGGCISTGEMDFVVTGVETTNPNSGINVYPNPLVNEVLHVRVAAGAKVGTIGVFNSLGTKLGDVKLAEKEGGREGTFDMRNSASGVYFVRTIVNKQAVTLKVIKK